jgi:transcriptional regulator with XRE-family HTH domain
MDDIAIACCDGAKLGRSLRTWRLLRRIKQHHLGELLGVSQTTVSRWENGQQVPTPVEQSAVRTLMQARLDSAADRELGHLVTSSAKPVHLICDLTHKLLALSPARERYCSVPGQDLMGTSLWRYASPEIAAAEAMLPTLGWFEPAAPAIEFHTGRNDSTVIHIHDSRLKWVRFQLSDGSFARLVETVEFTTAA